MRKDLPALKLLLLLLLSVTFAQQEQSSQAQTLAFTHVTVIDVAATNPKRGVNPNQTVGIRGLNVIAAPGQLSRYALSAAGSVTIEQTKED